MLVLSAWGGRISRELPCAASHLMVKQPFL